jgi:hypothetical protein
MEPPKKSSFWRVKKVNEMAGHLWMMPKRLPKCHPNTSKTTEWTHTNTQVHNTRTSTQHIQHVAHRHTAVHNTQATRAHSTDTQCSTVGTGAHSTAVGGSRSVTVQNR